MDTSQFCYCWATKGIPRVIIVTDPYIPSALELGNILVEMSNWQDMAGQQFMEHLLSLDESVRISTNHDAHFADKNTEAQICSKLFNW